MPIQIEKIKSLNLTELFSSDEQYIIPIYQRNYAWEAKEIEQLIQDIIDYSKDHPDTNYYIGTLVIAEEQNGLNIIDGQQRLTTLFILTSVIKNLHNPEVDLKWFNNINLDYASREKSKLSMTAAFNGIFENKEYEPNIRAAYDICYKKLVEKTSEHNVSITAFTQYLYKYVKILRVPLPDGTNLNHYFEIMNSRGEQLEKHEILKAKLMECFTGFEETEKGIYFACFDLIWEACSNMDKYVQYGFRAKDQRHIVFGENNWDSIAVFDFDEFVKKISTTLQNDANSNAQTIDEIISSNLVFQNDEEKEESPDRFNSVVNFQNFLLHVLRVQTRNNEIALDDKRLIDFFDKELPKKEDEKIKFAKEFIYNLLKCKFLFDKYVIKREFTANTDRWSLLKMQHYNKGKINNKVTYVNTFSEDQSESFDSNNRKILMLLSMFHVSLPSMSYKYWLNASLNYLFNQNDSVIDSNSYISYLEHIAKSFVFDRYLAKQPLTYFDMIFKNQNPIQRKPEQLDLEKLRYGKIENNLVFNFVDYLLWIKLKDKESDQKVKRFEYKFRSSVEHFFPQRPISGQEIETQYLHSFGNLCLISHADNSKYSNYLPDAKSTHYNNKEDIDSIKQFLMIKECLKVRFWNADKIQTHNEEMLQILIENCNSNFSVDREISLAQQWFKEFQIRNKVLLVRALLCFDDCSKRVNGNKFNLFDFDYIIYHDVFQKFEQYINEKSPGSLNEIINEFSNKISIKKNWRYFFIKHPDVISSCAEGNFIWDEDGRFIYLLETDKNTLHKSKEIYTKLIQDYFTNTLKLKTFCNNECFFIRINFTDEEYSITENYNDTKFNLILWNEGKSINYYLEKESSVNGNSNAVKFLEKFKWEKGEDGYYRRLGKYRLITFGENYEENLNNSIEELLRLLKNGFGIKLQ